MLCRTPGPSPFRSADSARRPFRADSGDRPLRPVTERHSDGGTVAAHETREHPEADTTGDHGRGADHEERGLHGAGLGQLLGGLALLDGLRAGVVGVGVVAATAAAAAGAGVAPGIATGVIATAVAAAVLVAALLAALLLAFLLSGLLTLLLAFLLTRLLTLLLAFLLPGLLTLLLAFLLTRLLTLLLAFLLTRLLTLLLAFLLTGLLTFLLALLLTGLLTLLLAFLLTGLLTLLLALLLAFLLTLLSGLLALVDTAARTTGGRLLAIHDNITVNRQGTHVDSRGRTRSGQRRTGGYHHTGGDSRHSDPRLFGHLTATPSSLLSNEPGPEAVAAGELNSSPGSHTPHRHACRTQPFPDSEDASSALRVRCPV
ncbi:hypothetical protein ACIBCM_18240 [Streptomyces sp. NPDC051018]|uniref:hypothetical protein n=1 Tax=Streptomyces sp. NPDC051018 TaxID=3365639 RepID=UPI0037AD4834